MIKKPKNLTRMRAQKMYVYILTHLIYNILLRTIISHCGTYNYNVAKFLTNLLSSYSRNDFNYVKDSFEIAEFIRQRQISNTEVLENCSQLAHADSGDRTFGSSA